MTASTTRTPFMSMSSKRINFHANFAVIPSFPQYRLITRAKYLNPNNGAMVMTSTFSSKKTFILCLLIYLCLLSATASLAEPAVDRHPI